MARGGPLVTAFAPAPGGDTATVAPAGAVTAGAWATVGAPAAATSAGGGTASHGTPIATDLRLLAGLLAPMATPCYLPEVPCHAPNAH